jgi:hypothetical protein
MRHFLLSLFLFACISLSAQVYPVFGNEIPVTITGCPVDAMEPFISPDGNTIFFNSLNDGLTTSLYYATRVNDSTFTYMGLLNGPNQITNPRLDAVASLDSSNRFFWVSTRNYPTQMDNLWHGVYNSGNVNNIGRVHGNFYVYQPGWIVMDAGINYDGNYLYACNAYFNNCNTPCIAKLAIAQKVNDSTYAKLPNSDALLTNVNDTAYIVYAPCITKDQLELYFTRIQHNTFTSEICVSVRNTPNDTFSLPSIIYSNSTLVPEAPTLTTNKSILYYHKKSGNIFKLFMRYRNFSAGIAEQDNFQVSVFPNPVSDQLTISLSENSSHAKVFIYDCSGKMIRKEENISGKLISIPTNDFAEGIYFFRIEEAEKIIAGKFIVNRD